VVHVWAGQLAQYAHFAHYQLSSLFLNPPEKCRVTHTTCHCLEDDATIQLLSVFMRMQPPETVNLRFHLMERSRLMRRAIGRNERTRMTTADVVWFAGCDYLYGPGCLDAIATEALKHPNRVCFPRQILRNKSHADGDRLVAEDAARVAASPAHWGALIQPKCDWEPQRINRPIGCLQIVSGDRARERGYLPNVAKYQKPAETWKRTFEDRAARAALGPEKQGIDVPNLYRLRHSKQGRFADAGGNVKPGKFKK